VTVNIFGDEWDESMGATGWRWKRLPSAAARFGADRGEPVRARARTKTYPYHWQVLEEEY
jgi:hypothetical protein